ncbi:hypothetical protein TNCV_563951 [Trichonephila clavipes]|nr:hypothetical protein TNCV_563951 [Trichonephila clavipes]
MPDIKIDDNCLLEVERRLNVYLNSNKLEQLENQHAEKLNLRWAALEPMQKLKEFFSVGCKIEWPPCSSDLISVHFRLLGYLKSLYYHLSTPSTLAELKDWICREVLAIHSDMLHSAVKGVVSCLSCVGQCCGG